MRARAHTLKIPVISRLSSRTLFFALSGLFVVIFIYYAYLINKTVMNVVAREQAESTIASLSGSVGDLEYKYITLRNNITLTLAHSKGFKDVTPSKFISRNTRETSQLTYNYSQ